MIYRPDGSTFTAAEIQAVRQTREDQVPTVRRVPFKPRTSSGVLMNADIAMTVSAVWACVRFLTQSIAKLTWRVRKAEGTNSEVQDKHPIDWMLYKRASPEWSSFQFRETMLYWALRWGNGYAEIERSIDGRAIALWPIPPYRVQVMRDRDDERALFYRVMGNVGGQVDLEPADVFHLRGLGEGPVGLDIMAYAAQSIGWVKAAQLFGAAFFGHGAQLAGVVTMKKALTPEAIKVLREDFDKLYGGGPNNANKTAFLDNEMDYKTIAVDPDKSQFVETNVFLLGEICRWMGVPPHKIYDLSKASFASIEHQSIEVVEDSLRPWIKRFEDEADFKLFGAQNRQNLFTQMETKRLLRPDTTSRMAFYQGMRNIGVLNADEIRDEEEFNAIGKAKGGEKYTMQSGMTTLEKIGEEVVNNAAAPPAPVDPSRPGPEEGEDPSPEDNPGPAKPDPAAEARRKKILEIRNRVYAANTVGEFADA